MRASVKTTQCFIAAILILIFKLYYDSKNFVKEQSFTIDYQTDLFVKDGENFDFISGSLHYFRVPHQMWKDRLLKLRASGINVVSSYIAWNLHEPQKGQFNFNGDADVVRFIRIAQSVGLLVNIRPGPYICSEWDLGGLPYFVLGTPKNCTKIRTKDPQYLEHVESYFSKLLPMLKPLLYENGGPIILVQVENEYGSYKACDSIYMGHLNNLMRKHLGDNIILYTADGWDMHHLICGPLHNQNVLTTVNFGPNSDHSSAFTRMRGFQKHGPLVNSEFYPGWLDHWGEPHQCKTPEYVGEKFKEMLTSPMGMIYVNFYMFFGGTNFGFYNGANMNNEPFYQPDPTSYDYDAPLSESGDFTDKYFAIRNIIKEQKPHLIDKKLEPLSPALTNSVKRAYGKVFFNEVVSFPNLKKLATKHIDSSPDLLTFEELQQDYGFILYEISSRYSNENDILQITGIRDMAYIFADDVYIGKLYRKSLDENSILLPAFKKLSLLVENMGRINYGKFMDDFKGILGEVKINDELLPNPSTSHWNMWSLPLNNTEQAIFTNLKGHPSTGDMLKGTFTIAQGQVADTWIRFARFDKGVVFVNGKNLGRYWSTMGPQKHLYVPSVWLREGQNEIVIFEVAGMPESDIYIELVDYPDVGDCGN